MASLHPKEASSGQRLETFGIDKLKQRVILLDSN